MFVNTTENLVWCLYCYISIFCIFQFLRKLWLRRKFFQQNCTLQRISIKNFSNSRSFRSATMILSVFLAFNSKCFFLFSSFSFIFPLIAPKLFLFLLFLRTVSIELTGKYWLYMIYFQKNVDVKVAFWCKILSYLYDP